MYLIAFCCGLLVTVTLSATAGPDFSSAPSCSSVRASSDTVPTILLNSENPTDNALLRRDFIVRKKSPIIRKFEIRCVAPYPIYLEFNSKLKKENIKTTTVTEEYNKAIGMFTITTFLFVGPEEDFYVNMSCIPDCAPTRFPSRIRIFTMTAPNNFKKILGQKITSQQGGNVRRGNDEKAKEEFFAAIWISIGTCVVLSAVVACVLLSWYSQLKSQTQRQEQIELDAIRSFA